MTRYVVLGLLAAAIVAGAGYLVYSRTLDKPPPAPAPTVQPVAPTPIVTREVHPTRVTAIAGRVERHVGDTWTELKVGDVLSVSDTIRTDEGARATLDAGVIVEVDDRTELTVGEITESLSELAIAEGRITADATGRGTTVRISTRNSDAVAQGEGGRFDVLSSGHGDLTVAARTGGVRLTAHDRGVDIGEGQYATAAAGKEPTAPAAIPPSLFLKVAAMHKAGSSEIRGEATPGAVVVVNGVTSVIAADGKFSTEVPVKRGSAQIVVRVEDVLGRRERKILARKVDRPKNETSVEWQ